MRQATFAATIDIGIRDINTPEETFIMNGFVKFGVIFWSNFFVGRICIVIFLPFIYPPLLFPEDKPPALVIFCHTD